MDNKEREWQYQTLTQTANSLHVSTGKLREWIKVGWIQAVKPGGKHGHLRVSVKSVKKFIEEHTTKRGDYTTNE